MAKVAVKKKHADYDQFFCDSDECVSCYTDHNIVQFIPGKNTEFPVERYKEKIGKSYSKIDLHFRNVCNVDRDVNLKVNKVTIHGNSNQTISNQLKHQQSTNTSPTENKKIPSFLVSQGQQEVRQNPSNGEDGFESFVSLN